MAELHGFEEVEPSVETSTPTVLHGFKEVQTQPEAFEEVRPAATLHGFEEFTPRPDIEPDSKISQIADIPRSIRAGAREAFEGMAIGADLMDVHVANKVGGFARSKQEDIVAKGGDAEGWKSQAYGFISDLSNKVVEAERGNISKRDAIRQTVLEKNEDLSRGMITDVAKGVGGMWDIIPSAISGGAFTLVSSPSRMFDEGYQDSLRSGKSEAEAMDTAVAYTLIASPLEMVADVLILKGKGGATKQTLMPILKTVAKKAGINFLSEGTTEVLQDAVLNKLNGRRAFTPESLRTFIVSGFVGSIAGGGTSIQSEIGTQRAIGNFEKAGLSTDDAGTAVTMMRDGDIDGAIAFASDKVNLSRATETLMDMDQENNPLDEAQQKRMDSLIEKGALTDKEEAELGALAMNFNQEQQDAIYARQQQAKEVEDATDTEQRATQAEAIEEDAGKPQETQEGRAQEAQVEGEPTPAIDEGQQVPSAGREAALPPRKDISLVGDDIEAIRESGGFSELSPQAVQKNIDTLNNAKATGADKNAETIAAEVLKKPRVVTPEEHAGMVVRAGQISNEIERLLKEIETQVDAGQDSSANQALLDGFNDALDTLTYAADLSKTEAGRALQIRKLRIALDSYSLVSLQRQAKAAKGGKLTPQQQQAITKLSNQIEEQTLKIKELEEEIANLESRDDADAEIKKFRKTRKARAKEDIRAERKSIKEELAGLGYRVNDVTGVTIESARLISKLAATYVEDGALTLKEVTEKVRSDIPDLSDKNVWDSIGGRVQKVSKRAKTETQKRLTEIKKQAKLSGQIEDAFNRVFDPKRKAEPTSKEVEVLKHNLKLLEAAYRKTETDDAKYQEKIRRIQELKDQIDGVFRDVKPNKAKETALVAGANKQIKTLLNKIKKLDQIADLEEQIRTGQYPKQKRTDSKSTELDALSDQIKFLKEEIALRTRGAIASGKTDVDVIIDLQKSLSKVKDQIDKGYRNLPIPKGKRGARVDEARTALKEMVDLRETLDKITDLREQIATGNYKVTTQERKTIKSKELADAKVKLHQLQRDARNNIFELRPKTARDLVKEVVTLPRSMLATMDMSYGLRQGLLPSFAHPVIAGKAWGKAFQAFFSQNKADAVDIDLKNHPLRPQFDKYGLHLSNIDSAINNREEFFASNLAEKIPGFGKVVMASERNMVTGLNLLRSGLMTDFLVKHPTAPEEAKKAYANYVNIATGRGDLGRLSGAAEELSLVFFAPRFAVSRVQAPYKAVEAAIKHPELRGEMAKQWGAMLGTGASVLALAAAAGAEVGLDPEDSDWGKIIIGGNKRIDIWFGIQQPMRVLALTLKAIYQKVTTGETDIDPRKAVESFLKYKQAPLISLPNELITGKDIIGREVEPANIGDFEIPPWAVSTASHFIPLVVQSAAEAYREGEDPAVVAALAIGEGLGLSIGVYDKD